MLPQNTYISLGISPDGTALVLQPVVPNSLRPFFVCTFSISELNSWGRAVSIARTGRIALTSMQALYPHINIYAEALISERKGGRPTVDVPDKSGVIRDNYLRIHFSDGDRSIHIRRFCGAVPAGPGVAPMGLEQLIERGPEGATLLVGEAVLAELGALHPDVFAPFSELQVAIVSTMMPMAADGAASQPGRAAPRE